MNSFDYLLEFDTAMLSRTSKGGAIVARTASSREELSKAQLNSSVKPLEIAADELIIVDRLTENSATSVLAGSYGALSQDYAIVEAVSQQANTVSLLAEDGKATDGEFFFSFNDNNITITGTNGNDTIEIIGGNNQTLVGGAGSDTYKVLSNLGEGICVTIDQTGAAASDEDRLQLSQVSKEDISVHKEGKNLVINKINGGKLVITNWEDHELAKVSFSDGVLRTDDIQSLSEANGDTATETGNTKALSVIQSFMKALDDTTLSGFAAVDEAVAACSNGRFNSLEALVNAFVGDCTTNSGDTVAQQKAFLEDYCDIKLDNIDTGAITGADAGGSVVKTASSIVDEGSATLDSFVYDTSKYTVINTYDNSARALGTGSVVSGVDCYSANINGVTFYWNENNWSSLGVDTKVLEQIMGGLLNSWLGASMNLIEESYGMTLDEEGSKLRNYKYTSGIKAIQIAFDYDENSSTVAKVWSAIGNTGSGTNVKTVYATEVLVINTAYFRDSLKDVDGSSRYSSVGSLDRIIAHEITHGVMAADVNAFNKLPVFIKEGLAELVHGIDDTRAGTILELCDTSYNNYWSVDGVSTLFNQKDLLSAIFNLETANTEVGTETYAAGYLLLRYLAKQVAEGITESEDSSKMLADITSLSNAVLSFDNSGTYSSLNEYSRGSYEIVPVYSTGAVSGLKL